MQILKLRGRADSGLKLGTPRIIVSRDSRGEVALVRAKVLGLFKPEAQDTRAVEPFPPNNSCVLILVESCNFEFFGILLWKAIVKYVVLSIIKLWSLLPAFPHMLLNTFGYLSIRSQCHVIAEYFIYTVVYDS